MCKSCLQKTHKCKSCRSRQELSREYLVLLFTCKNWRRYCLTAENEPLKVCQKLSPQKLALRRKWKRESSIEMLADIWPHVGELLAKFDLQTWRDLREVHDERRCLGAIAPRARRPRPLLSACLCPEQRPRVRLWHARTDRSRWVASGTPHCTEGGRWYSRERTLQICPVGHAALLLRSWLCDGRVRCPHLQEA